MRVTVLVFGVLREAMGGGGERAIDMPAGATADDLVQLCRASAGAAAGVWDVLAVAVNQEYSRRDRVLCDGDVVALLPPVSGG